MAIIPRPDPNDFRYKKKTPSLDEKAKLQIVYDALISATENQVYGNLKLTPNPTNQLNKLFRYEILEILKWKIEKEAPLAFQIEESNYGKELVPENERESTMVEPGVYSKNEPFYRPAPLPENVPIKLTLYDNFANWRDSYLHKKNLRLSDLNVEIFKKIYQTIIDIDEKFQPTSSPVLIIPWYHNVETQTFEARKDALKFLENKGAVEYFELKHAHGQIKVWISIKEFQKIKKEAEDVLQKKSQKMPSTKTTAQHSEKKVRKSFEYLKRETLSYKVTITANDEVLINGLHFSKPHNGNENAKVIKFLIANPKREITRKELETQIGPVGKDLRKIIENLGFSGLYLKAFFRIVKNQSVFFRNPVTHQDLKSLQIDSLPTRQTPRKKK